MPAPTGDPADAEKGPVLNAEASAYEIGYARDETARTSATTAATAARTAQDTAEAAGTAAMAAQRTADAAATPASVTAARNAATDAQATADRAETAAGEAKTAADGAQTTADRAETAAGEARTAANNAQATADRAETAAGEAKTAADNAQTAADSKRTAEQVTAAIDDRVTAEQAARIPPAPPAGAAGQEKTYRTDATGTPGWRDGAGVSEARVGELIAAHAADADAHHTPPTVPAAPAYVQTFTAAGVAVDGAEVTVQTIAITPRAAATRVHVTGHVDCEVTGGTTNATRNLGMELRLYRGAVLLVTRQHRGSKFASGEVVHFHLDVEWLDSPGSGDEQTYTIRVARQGGNRQWTVTDRQLVAHEVL